MRTEGGKYQVKLVPAHCHREETIVAIFSALDHLSLITNEIFSSIKERLAIQKEQVQSLNARVAVTVEKVAQLKSSQSGIRITSSAKYPSSFPEDESKGVLSVTFPTLNTKPIPPQGSSIDPEILEMLQEKSGFLSPPVKDPSELLQFYHVRDVSATNVNIDRLESLYETGLGAPSCHLNTTDSFLLFNTAENPYQNYNVIVKDSKKNLSTRIPKKVEFVEALTVTKENENDKTNQPEGDDFYYYPSSVDIPEIDVPDLDLPGIASMSLGGQTLDFGSGSIFPNSMFPSSAKRNDGNNIFASPSTSTVPSTSQSTTPMEPSSGSARPQVENNNQPISTSSSLADALANSKLASNTTNKNPIPPVVSSSSSAPPPPPPPMPGFDIWTATSIPPPAKSTVTATTTSTSGGPPPPPPPPLPNLSDFDSGDSKTKEASNKQAQQQQPSKLPSGGDLHSNLMEAIRAAGGTGKLRSAKDRKFEAKMKKQEEKEKKNIEGGDMMADLKNSLAMRRRGISGNMSSKKQAGLSDIMSKLAETIPTLEDSNEEVGGASFSDDEDWYE